MGEEDYVIPHEVFLKIERRPDKFRYYNAYMALSSVVSSMPRQSSMPRRAANICRFFPHSKSSFYD